MAASSSESLKCSLCEGEGDVVGVVAPLGGVAQVIFHGVQDVEVGVQVRVHEEGEKKKDGEVQVEVEREVEENQGEPHIMDATWRDGATDTSEQLEPMWCDTLSTRRTTTNSSLQCSLVQVARVVLVHVILVGVRGVTVDVHIGHDEVHVVV